MLVLVAYALGTALILPALGWLQRLLFLPELFLRMAWGGLALGVPLAVFLAWRYPDIGNGSG